MTGPQLESDRNYVLLAALTHVDALELARSYIEQLDGNSDRDGGQILWQLCKKYDTIDPEELAQHLAVGWRTTQETDTVINSRKAESPTSNYSE